MHSFALSEAAYNGRSQVWSSNRLTPSLLPPRAPSRSFPEQGWMGGEGLGATGRGGWDSEAKDLPLGTPSSISIAVPLSQPEDCKRISGQELVLTGHDWLTAPVSTVISLKSLSERTEGRRAHHSRLEEYFL